MQAPFLRDIFHVGLLLQVVEYDKRLVRDHFRMTVRMALLLCIRFTSLETNGGMKHDKVNCFLDTPSFAGVFYDSSQ